MSEAEVSKKSRPGAAWALLVLGIIAGGGGIFGQVLSPSVALDLISLWPLTVVVLVVGVVQILRHKSAALIPLGLLSYLVLGVGIHLSQWLPLPSSSGDIVSEGVAPPAGVFEVVLDSGSLVVQGSSDLIYAVRPMRSGGVTPAPSVLESLAGESIFLSAVPRADDRWFRFGGWVVDLNQNTSWALDLSSPDLALRLDGLAVSTVEVAGGGSIDLGPTQTADVEVAGDFHLSVPLGTAVTVFGDARVPLDWSVVEGGYRSPGLGPGWVVTVISGSVDVATN